MKSILSTLLSILGRETLEREAEEEVEAKEAVKH
jgi:hypothetical protein